MEDGLVGERITATCLFGSAVATAEFNPVDGRLFVIRNGMARWDSSDNPLAKQMFKAPGHWNVTSQWHEIYDADSELEGADELPAGGTEQFVVDIWTYFPLARRRHNILRDAARNSACVDGFVPLTILYVDSPSGHEPLSVASGGSSAGMH